MRAILGVCLLCATAAWAGKKTVVVGAGDCKDGALLSAVKDFHDLARGQLKGDLAEHEGVLRAVRPQANRSVDDIQRQLDTARSLLYGGQHERGLELVQDALTDLERVSPQAKPWPLTAAALVLQSQMLKALERPKDSAEAFRRVLRVEPGFKLDPDSYPPSTLSALEAVRKELARARKGALQVISTPVGAQVFVDGREVGKTPLTVNLPQGSYRVALTSGDAVSFPHKVALDRGESLQIDMAFEGAVATSAPVCVAGFVDDSSAITLASTVATEQVVVVRNTAVKGDPPYITGTLYDVGRGERVRNAGVRPQQLRDLMLYLFTGKPDISALPPPPPPLVGDATPTTRPEPPLVRVGGASDRDVHSGTESEVRHVQSGPPPSTARIVSYAAIGVGVVAGAVGVVVFTTGSGDRAAYQALLTPSGKLPDPVTASSDNAKARSLLGPIATNQAISFTLIGAGAGAIVGGVLGMLLFPASAAPSVAVVPTREGAAVSVSGRF